MAEKGKLTRTGKAGILKGHLFALLSVTAWGTSFLVSKNLMEDLSPVQLMVLRFIIAWLALWGIHPKWRFHWKEEGQFLGLTLIGNTLYFPPLASTIMANSYFSPLTMATNAESPFFTPYRGMG